VIAFGRQLAIMGPVMQLPCEYGWCLWVIRGVHVINSQFIVRKLSGITERGDTGMRITQIKNISREPPSERTLPEVERNIQEPSKAQVRDLRLLRKSAG